MGGRFLRVATSVFHEILEDAFPTMTSDWPSVFFSFLPFSRAARSQVSALLSKHTHTHTHTQKKEPRTGYISSMALNLWNISAGYWKKRPLKAIFVFRRGMVRFFIYIYIYFFFWQRGWGLVILWPGRVLWPWRVVVNPVIRQPRPIINKKKRIANSAEICRNRTAAAARRTDSYNNNNNNNNNSNNNSNSSSQQKGNDSSSVSISVFHCGIAKPAPHSAWLTFF